jgi:hypothetical protein
MAAALFALQPGNAMRSTYGLLPHPNQDAMNLRLVEKAPALSDVPFRKALGQPRRITEGNGHHRPLRVRPRNAARVLAGDNFYYISPVLSLHHVLDLLP